jgi:predicted component of type VI protein secretion system
LSSNVTPYGCQEILVNSFIFKEASNQHSVWRGIWTNAYSLVYREVYIVKEEHGWQRDNYISSLKSSETLQGKLS